MIHDISQWCFDCRVELLMLVYSRLRLAADYCRVPICLTKLSYGPISTLSLAYGSER
jgi:hypothetical protein